MFSDRLELSCGNRNLVPILLRRDVIRGVARRIGNPNAAILDTVGEIAS